MAGGRQRRRKRRRAPPLQVSESSPLAFSTLSPREVAVVERPSNIVCHTSGSSSLPSFGPHVWADLLECLLHEIIALFGSFHDYVAFASTCRSWRDAVSSFASVYAFSFPPLHLKPDVCFAARQFNSSAQYMFLSDCKWKIINPAKRDPALRCSVPPNIPNQMLYMGSSYGYLIFFHQGHSLLVNVYTGTEVKSPILLDNDRLGDIYCGTLMAPGNSTNLHLLLFSKRTMCQWQIGTDSWLEHPLGLDGERLEQTVWFKGDIFAVDILGSCFIIRFGPQFSTERVQVKWGVSMILCGARPWLVVACGDMILRLDRSVEPAGLVEMEKLDNHALFISLDRRNPTSACSRPERWGGKSNCIYVARQLEDSDEPWTAVEIGLSVPDKTEWIQLRSPNYPPEFDVHCSNLEGLWMLPYLVCERQNLGLPYDSCS